MIGRRTFIASVGGGGVGYLTAKSQPQTELQQARIYDAGPDSRLGGYEVTKNPVLDPSSSGWDSARVYHPNCLIVDDTIYLYYSGSDDHETLDIGLATSPLDPVDFTRRTSGPILETGGRGDFDSQRLETPSVWVEGDTWHMVYAGVSGTRSIGHATSPDGVNWTKDDANPVLTPTENGWDSGNVAHPNVINEGGVKRMIYGADDYQNWQLGLAHSIDSQNWTRSTSEPVMQARGGWEGESLEEVAHLRVGETHHILYGAFGNGHWAIGHASSPDLKTWYRDPGNPVIHRRMAGGWDQDHTAHPTMIRRNGGFDIFYFGDDGTGRRSIGHARFEFDNVYS